MEDFYTASEKLDNYHEAYWYFGIALFVALILGALFYFGSKTPKGEVDGVLLKDLTTGQCVYLPRSTGHGISLIVTPCPKETSRGTR
jgi:hypothetical protein